MFNWLRDKYWRWQAKRNRARRAPWERGPRSHGLFPAYADIGGGSAVDRDGEVWYSEEPMEWTDVRRVEDPALRHAILGVAVRRHPELAHIWPKRGANDLQCPGCGGTGVFGGLPVQVRHNIICQCGGLGWIPGDLAHGGAPLFGPAP